jgi:hypothetical protein
MSNNYGTLTRLEDKRHVVAPLAKGEGINNFNWDGVVETRDISTLPPIQSSSLNQGRSSSHQTKF